MHERWRLLVALTAAIAMMLAAAVMFGPATPAPADVIDLSSGGPVGLPNAYFGTAQIPHLVFEHGKDGYAYLLNRDNLGGYRQGPGGTDAVVSRIGPFGGVWGKAGVWPGQGGYLYVVTSNPKGGSDRVSSGNLLVYKYKLDSNGKPTIALAGTSSDAFPFGSGSPVVSSNGTTAGSALVWTIWRSPQESTNPRNCAPTDPFRWAADRSCSGVLPSGPRRSSPSRPSTPIAFTSQTSAAWCWPSARHSTRLARTMLIGLEWWA